MAEVDGVPPPLPLPPADAADSAAWSDVASRIDGEVLADPVTRMLYATDASPYEQLPLGVVRPRHREDCIAIVLHAARHRIPLIPRAAGTSLAGQCVGEGLVVDVSRHMTTIVEIDVAASRARVQPGVILEDLNDALGNDALGNDALGPQGLQFAPDTSTGNRCMIAGMIGNNACGAYSIRHGTTRDHVIEIETVLADGTLASFGPLDGPALEAKRRLPTLEGRIYREVFEIIDAHRESILQRYPRPEVVRRNTGYALDVLAGHLMNDSRIKRLLGSARRGSCRCRGSCGASGVRTHGVHSKDAIANKGDPAGSSGGCKVERADKVRTA